MSKRALAFDVYGTLIDTHGVVEELSRRIGERAGEFSQRWREKQLEYAFRRGLMGAFVDFSQCTREALEFVDRALGTRLSDTDKERLMATYGQLPAFADVAPALERLGQLRMQRVAFSNGSRQAVSQLLDQAGVLDRFDDIVSVEELKRFKPDPAVYAHLHQRIEADAHDTWLVSSNPFDVIGAKHAGLRAVWVRRSAEAPFDPWGGEPDMTVADLGELASAFSQ
ncbi:MULTISPECIES: haloacid dehalogenase type II [Halomonadaceae]|uniref:(S)-2-haloacid dehalogenase n=1 Tax=Modicisalibacter zincidurans TaxID=1178777 RepID=A0ABP9RFB1_9GAMM|nr:MULTISPECIES: haloacid dehalogenase type II [Halomonas]MCD6007492.1 haloacid dehalogenase type II [Halomonas sp. IOP_31]MEA3251714.1 haloacid dehalogenase type II [Pseudomonadota bacterium]